MAHDTRIYDLDVFDGKGWLKLLVYPFIIVGIEWERQLGVLMINSFSKRPIPSSGYATRLIYEYYILKLPNIKYNRISLCQVKVIRGHLR